MIEAHGKMKGSTLRVFCAVVGILGLAFILASKATTPAKVTGSLLCVFIIMLGFIATGRFRKYITGEYMEGDTPYKDYGNMGGSLK